eukprot:PhF_6_TR30553/c0_g1_i3/m.44862
MVCLGCYYVFNIRGKWERTVLYCGFPGHIIRYHIMTIIPAAWYCFNSSSPFFYFVGIVHLLVLAPIHVITAWKIRFRHDDTDDTPLTCFQRLVRRRGKWVPELCVAMSGPLFSSYAPIFGMRGGMIAHSWTWGVVTIGVVMCLSHAVHTKGGD